MYIGFEQITGMVYEGASTPQYAVWPSPVLCQAKLIENDSDWNDLPKGIIQSPFAWIFREDIFDPVTRIRRGRLYEAALNAQPSSHPVSAHPFDYEGVRQVAASRQLTKNLYAYCPCQSFLNRGDKGLGATLAIGQGQSFSFWKVVQTELAISNDVMVILKATTAYGIIPEIDTAMLDGESRQSVERALERVVNSAFRESPISVVDQCRNAAAIILSRWLVKQGAPNEFLKKDLGDISKAIGNEPYNKLATHNVAEVVRLLHPRGKANEQESKGLRIPVEEDAELAIHSLGFILREIGWAK